MPPPARQLVDPWRGVAHRSALIGQQQPGRPVGFLFSSLLRDATQAADWSAGSGERPDGSVERLVGGGGRVDVRKLLEVKTQTALLFPAYKRLKTSIIQDFQNKSHSAVESPVVGLHHFLLQVRGAVGEQLPVSTQRLPVCICVADRPLPAHRRSSGEMPRRRRTPPQN